MAASGMAQPEPPLQKMINALEKLTTPDPKPAEDQGQGSDSARVTRRRKMRLCVVCREEGKSKKKQKTANITQHFKSSHKKIYDDKKEYDRIRESCPYIYDEPSVQIQCQNTSNNVESYIKRWLSFEPGLNQQRKVRQGNRVKEFMLRSIGDQMQHNMSYELLDVSI